MDYHLLHDPNLSFKDVLKNFPNAKNIQIGNLLSAPIGNSVFIYVYIFFFCEINPRTVAISLVSNIVRHHLHIYSCLTVSYFTI